MDKNINFDEEFLQGQIDCKEGVEHKKGKSEAYTRGYAAQYQHEQNMEHMTRNEHE